MPTAIWRASRFIDKAVLDDRTIYPDAAMMARLYTITAHDQKTQRLMNRLWTGSRPGGSGCIPDAAKRCRIRCLQSELRMPDAARRARMTAALPPAAVQPQPLLGMLAHPAFDHGGDRLHGACDVDLAVGVARRRRSPRSARSGSGCRDRRTTRMPWIGQSMCRASRAISGLALQRRPKNVTSTPRGAVLVDQHADMRPRSSASASCDGASRPVGISSPMLPARMRDDGVGDGRMFGRR